MNDNSVAEFSPHKFEDFPSNSQILIYSPDPSEMRRIYAKILLMLRASGRLAEGKLFPNAIVATNGCAFIFASREADKVRGKEFDYVFATRNTDPVMLRFLKSLVRPRQGG